MLKESPMAEDCLAQRIQHQLRETVSEGITVGVGGTVIYLSGRVPSRADRRKAETVAREMSGGMDVENDLEVERLLPEDRIEVDSPYLGEADLFAEEDSSDVDENGNPLEPDFTSQPLESNEEAASDAGVADNPPDEPDPVYFPPTDPVLKINAEGHVDVNNGFAPTGMDELEVQRSAEDNMPGDEALADAVRQALAEDAATTDLSLHVHVNQGVVHLRGRVSDLEDAENAEAVASEVPGVRHVIDETTVEHI
jgi:osmotically-inducible protein OsmY